MDRHATVALVLALLVLVAGCGSAGQTESPAGSPAGPAGSPAGATATPSPTPTVGLDDVPMPAGLSKDGVTDRGALLSAHETALSGASVTVSMDFVLKVNGTGQNVSLLAEVTPDDDVGWMRVKLPDGTGTYYTKGDTTYKRIVQGGTTTYGTTDRVSAIPSRPRFGADLRISQAIDAANWTATGVVVRNGTRLVRYEATDVTLPDRVNASQIQDVESRGVMLVSTTGVVHRVTVYTKVEEAGGGTIVYRIDVRLTDVGSTTTERPAWIEKAT